MNVELSPPDLAPLRDAVAAVGEFNREADDRRNLLKYAGLGRFVPSLKLTTNAQTFAGELVLRLADYGPLPEQPGKHALGALLGYLLTLGDLSRNHARLFAETMVKYGLVEDREFLERLRAEFGLAVALPVGPPPRAEPVATPAFQPDFADRAALEDVIHSEDNFLDMALLVGALYCSRAVCRIERPSGTALGTGVLVGPDLLLTNQHVLTSQDALDGAVARFDHRILDGTGVAEPGVPVPLRTDFYHASPAEALDYALARTEVAPLQAIVADEQQVQLPLPQLAATGKHRGFLPAVSRFLKERDRVNILQHPGVLPLKVVLTQNYVAMDMSERRVQYVADTMPGSSGSPVFNGNWELVALHHSGQPYPPDGLGDAARKLWKGRFRVNEGIPMRAILADLTARDCLRYLPTL